MGIRNSNLLGRIRRIPIEVIAGIVGVAISIVLIIVLVYTGLINWGEFALSFTTTVLATATFILGTATYSSVSNQITEGKKERYMLRLKGQIEELYSPLKANLNLFKTYSAYSLGLVAMDQVSNVMQNIKNKYEFYAEPELKEELRKYYLKRDEAIVKRFGTKEFDELFRDKVFQENLNRIQVLIERDFNELSTEYSRLTEKT